jgi:hypothetical protein
VSPLVVFAGRSPFIVLCFVASMRVYAKMEANGTQFLAACGCLFSWCLLRAISAPEGDA